VDRDTYLVAGITDHLCLWQSCYRSTQLLSGSRRFVLSTSGHIAAMVDPPGNEKARYQVAKENPEDPQEWLRHAENGHGSWWPDYASWLAEPRKDPAVARDLLHLTSRLGPARGYCYQLLSGIG
jgi:poly(3-hydroxyalkanoate) synthetase